MDFHNFIPLLISSLIGAAIPFVFWVAVIVFTRIVQKRGGSRAERFLITGAAINLGAVILSIPMAAVTSWLLSRDYSIDFISTVTTSLRIGLETVSMAGTICIIYAFWVKFNNREAVPYTETVG